MQTDTEFFHRSKTIAETFLQSVVIVDDYAFRKKTIDVPGELTPPPELSTEDEKGISLSIGGDAGQEAAVPAPTDLGSKEIDPKKVVDGFANKGITCAVLEPSESEMELLTSKILKLAEKSDIIILDWYLHSDNGENALKVLKGLIGRNNKNPQQLSLFVIYTTANPQVVKICERIQEKIRSEAGEPIVDDRGFTLTSHGIRTVIFLKPEKTFDQYKDRQVEFDELADRVTIEFTKMTAGLIPNAVLSSLSLLRKNAYKILNKFSADIDAPYLTHRVLLSSPDEAEDYLPILISEEFKGILDESRVGREANIAAISEWVTARELDGANFNLKVKNVTFVDSHETMINLLRKGIFQVISDKEGVSKDIKKKIENVIHKQLTALFRSPNIDIVLVDERFAHLTSVSSHYGDAVPTLTLGTILKKVNPANDSDFWICITPRCDSVRIGENRNFLFMRLMPNDEQFSIILEEGGNYSRFLHKKKAHFLKLIEFASNHAERQVVIGYKIDQTNDFFFRDIKEQEYKWLGELKPSHAQRLSYYMTASLSRIGLDESEWLRLWAKEGY